VFTGLIEAVGTLVSWETRGRVVRISVRTPLAPDLAIGSSIAIDGVCQTVVHAGEEVFSVEATGETLKRTTLASWRGPRPVNLERPVRAGDRFDGHLVTGHIDAVVRVVNRRTESSGTWIDVMHAASLAHLIASQGSVALDGVSLTVATCTSGSFAVSLIPHTLEHTTLGRKQPGDYLNMEVDLVARYVERLLRRGSHWSSREEGTDEWV